MSRPTFTHAFPAMGTTIELTLVGLDAAAAEGAFDLAVRQAEEWEATFSRFRQESELSRLNARAGQWVRVSDRLLLGIVAALRARRETQGLFDPTILPALVALGYDRSFDTLRECTCMRAPARPAFAAGQRVEVAPAWRGVRVAEGAMLDLGGIAKGMFADALAARLADWPGGAISAGGDLRVWGLPPDGRIWTVGVEDPDDRSRDIALIALASGAVATSSDNRRAWQVGDRRCHHLIDPRTGRPAESGVRAVSAVAGTAADAEVAATALFVGGVDPAHVARLENAFFAAVAVLASGDVRVIPGNVSCPPHAAIIHAA